jgi:hypothetical protein
MVNPVPAKRTPLGFAGLIAAMVALTAAALSPWAMAALDPPRKSVDEVALDVAGRIKDRIAARAKGQPYVAPAEPARSSRASRYMAAVIGAGALAVCVGVFGLACGHDTRLNASTVAVGASAIVFQYALVFAALLLFILLVGLVLAAMGGGAP